MRISIRFMMAFALSCIVCPAQATGTAVQTVVRLYHRFAWEAVIYKPSAPGLAEQPKAVLLQYFTPKLASALVADAACTKQRHEVCALDFVPLWASQDPAAEDLTIFAGPNAEQVNVQFTYPSTGQVICLIYRMVPTKAGWRVADIIYPSGYSLAHQLLRGAE